MLTVFRSLFSQNTWWSYLLLSAFLLLIAWVFHRLSWWLGGRIVRFGHVAGNGKKPRLERQQTVQSLIANTISFIALAAVILIALSRMVGAANVVWMVGLFGAAFGIGASQHIRDLSTGLSFMFEDSIAVGEKVEVMGVAGVVEAVRLRTTRLRSPTGELYSVPNGDIRLIRNFSRGRFSMIEITLKLAASDLSRALPLLEEMGKEAANAEPDLLEPWQIITETGVLSQQTDLKLLAKARWGKAAEMRPRLLALIQERLAEMEVSLAG